MIGEKFKTLLSKNNLRLTSERMRLFNELKDSPAPLTINNLVKRTSDTLDQSTVYRNLDLFEELGVTHRVYTGWKYKVELSDSFKSHHHHMLCSNCGVVIEFHESKELIKDLDRISKKYSFNISNHSLEITGTCSNCS
ncbi:transcriptional repressor [Candidatus Saccharibacteria bacterium]|nr:transcriptional repressor [Candidatus Saccharibacteria bacterium]